MENGLSITRVFDAPRSAVWNAFTQPEHLEQWWGPKGFKIEVRRLELRPGGVFHYSMRMPNGAIMWGRFTYREIEAPERLVFTNSFSDESGGLTRNPWMPVWPLEALTTVIFSESEGKTTITLTSVPVEATEEERQNFLGQIDSMKNGFGGTFDQLAEYLAQ